MRSNEKDEVCHNFIVNIFTKSPHRGGVRDLRSNFGPIFSDKVHWKAIPYMSMIKVALPLIYSSLKKNCKGSVDFWHRKITLKIRIALFLTFKKQNVRHKFFWTYQVGARAMFIHPWTQLCSTVQLRSCYHLHYTWQNFHLWLFWVFFIDSSQLFSRQNESFVMCNGRWIVL